MTTVPTKKNEMLTWLQQRSPVWAESTDDLGLTESQVTAMQAQLMQAAAAYAAAVDARNTAKSLMQTADTKLNQLRQTAGALVRVIRGHAIATNNPDTYDIAEIPPPATPSSKGAPGIPTNLTSSADNMCRVMLKWKSTNSAASTGAVFQIRRKLAGQSKFRLIATVQGRKFQDDSIPAGTDSAIYIVKGIRGEAKGEPSEPTTVYFHSVQTGDEDGELGLAA